MVGATSAREALYPPGTLNCAFPVKLNGTGERRDE